MRTLCAIFDFDGTLFDSMAVWDTAGMAYLMSIGVQPDPSLSREIHTMSLRQAACYLRERYHLTQPVEEILTGILQTVEQSYRYQIQPKAGVREFLKTMRRLEIPMCIATATDRSLVEVALRRCRLDGFFERIFTCEEVGCGKELPTIYQEARRYFGVDCVHTLVFEDAVYAARTAKMDGCFVVAVFDAYEWQQEELRRICDGYLSTFECPDSVWELIEQIRCRQQRE